MGIGTPSSQSRIAGIGFPPRKGFVTQRHFVKRNGPFKDE
jgi:hypothetical protein